jgi:hypothetical protein
MFFTKTQKSEMLLLLFLASALSLDITINPNGCNPADVNNRRECWLNFLSTYEYNQFNQYYVCCNFEELNDGCLINFDMEFNNTITGLSNTKTNHCGAIHVETPTSIAGQCKCATWPDCGNTYTYAYLTFPPSPDPCNPIRSVPIDGHSSNQSCGSQSNMDLTLKLLVNKDQTPEREPFECLASPIYDERLEFGCVLTERQTQSWCFDITATFDGTINKIEDSLPINCKRWASVNGSTITTRCSGRAHEDTSFAVAVLDFAVTVCRSENHPLLSVQQVVC